MNRIAQFLKPATYGWAADSGLLVLRAGIGLVMMTHGWSKFADFSAKAGNFYDFIGIGSELTLGLTVFAELFCSLLLVLGLGARLCLIALIILAVVIVFGVHSSDPFGDKEHGLLFLVPYITLILTGPGKYALDYLIFPRSGNQQ